MSYGDGKVDLQIPDKIIREGVYMKRIVTKDGSIFTLQNGVVLAYGNNEYGQLGLGDTTNRSTPEKINIPNKKVVQIVSVDTSTFFITGSGECFACGSNFNGQLGLGDTTNRSTPEKINIPNEEIVQVIPGKYNTFFKTKSGKWFACGYNRAGQLGLGDTTDRSIPAEITIRDGRVENWRGEVQV